MLWSQLLLSCHRSLLFLPPSVPAHRQTLLDYHSGEETPICLPRTMRTWPGSVSVLLEVKNINSAARISWVLKLYPVLRIWKDSLWFVLSIRVSYLWLRQSVHLWTGMGLKSHFRAFANILEFVFQVDEDTSLIFLNEQMSIVITTSSLVRSLHGVFIQNSSSEMGRDSATARIINPSAYTLRLWTKAIMK